MNRRKYIALVVAVLAVAVTVWLAGCHGGRSQGKGNFYNIRKIDLRLVDKKHVLQIARQALRGESISKDEDRYPLIYNDEPRGVFLTLARPNEPALTGFGFGSSIYDATLRAADVLRRLSSGEDIEKLRLRVDVMDESTDEQDHDLGKKWSASALDISLYGIIFDTNPAAAFLPQELRDSGVIGKEGKYSKNAMHRLIKQRSLGKALYSQLDEKQTVRYATFTAVSFMESGGDQPLLLFRGHLAEDYEATPDRLLTAIRAAGTYLKKAVRQDGRFDYLYFPQTSHLSKGYNELRHAGTLFSMGQIYQITKDPDLLAAIKRGLAYLDKISLGPAPEEGPVDFRAVAEPTELYSKLGGTGLALLAYGEYTQVAGDQQYVELMRAYGRFVEFMQKPDGDMRMRYWRRPEDKNKPEHKVLYYPGEAFFGMSKLYWLDNRNERWKKVALRGLDFIADQRDAATPTDKLEHDHWLMYAINEWYRVQPQKNLLDHAYRLTDAMLGRFNFQAKYPDFVGGFFNRPASTAAATRLEGLAAVYRLAQHVGDKKQMDRLYEALRLGASFLMRNQYDEINTMFFQNPEKAFGGYMGSFWSPEIQIDYVQHATSALVVIREIIMERAQTSAQPQATPLPNAA